MNFRFEFLPDAESDLVAAADWFEEHTSLGGAGFTEVIAQAVDEICSLPHAWPRWRLLPRFQVRSLRRLRYQIFFEVREDVVRIFAISHTSRKPGHWLERTR